MREPPDIRELIECADIAIDLLRPGYEPKHRVARTSLRSRDNLFSIVMDAYPYLDDHRRRVADSLYDAHILALEERGLTPLCFEAGTMPKPVKQEEVPTLHVVVPPDDAPQRHDPMPAFGERPIEEIARTA